MSWAKMSQMDHKTIQQKMLINQSLPKLKKKIKVIKRSEESKKQKQKQTNKKNQATDGEKIFAICISDKGLLSRIQINKAGKQSNPRWAETRIDTL